MKKQTMQNLIAKNRAHALKDLERGLENASREGWVNERLHRKVIIFFTLVSNGAKIPQAGRAAEVSINLINQLAHKGRETA